MDHYYLIADLVVKMNPKGRTYNQALPYEISPREYADICISEDDYLSTYQTWEEHGYLKYVENDIDRKEYLASGSIFYRKLLHYNGMMLHSSAVVVDGKAYLFTADPGTGKSTHTNLWLKEFGDRAFILNDDKPAIRFENGAWYAYGTPWSGKDDLSKNARVPLAGIAALERAQKNVIFPIEGDDAIAAISRQINRTSQMNDRVMQLELLDKLISHVCVWRLKCNMEREAAVVAYEAMSNGNF